MAALQALEWVIPHITNVRTLAACSLLNQSLRNITLSHIKQNLPSILLAQLEVVAYEDEIPALQWLCQCAGAAAMSTTAAQDAFLQLLARMGAQQAMSACDTWAKACPGVAGSTDLLVAAAKLRVPHVAALSYALYHQELPPSLDENSAPFSALHAAVAEYGTQEVTYEIVERLIWCMAPEELPNALHLACNNRWGSEIALRLLQEDASRLHLLQPEPAMHPRGEQPDQQQSEQQQQQQHTQLVSELLKTCVLRRHQAVMPKLVSLPAAQCIGPEQVTQLLHLAMIHAPYMATYKYVPEIDIYESDDEEHNPDHFNDQDLLGHIISSLLQLPGAQSMPCASIVSILKFTIHSRVDYDVEQIVQLPGMQQISSKVLCQLLQEAGLTTGSRDPDKLLPVLTRVMQGRDLDREHVLGVLKHSIDNALTYAFDMDLQLGKHITGADVVDLLHYATSEGPCVVEPLRQIWQLKPAVEQVEDVDLERFAAALLTIVVCGSQGSTVAHSLLQLPIAQKLQPHHCFELIKLWPTSTWPYGVAPCAACPAWELPGVQQVDVVALAELIVIAVVQQEFGILPKLVQLPAAAQLSPSSLCLALTHMGAEPVVCTEAFQVLLSVPAAQRMPEVRCRALLECIWQHGHVAYLDLLLEQLPVVLHMFQHELPPAALQEIVVAAADQGNEAMVLRCLDHERAAWLPPGAVYRLVEAAAPAVWTPTVMSRLRRSPGAQLLQLYELVSLLNVAFCKTAAVDDPVLQQWLAFELVQRLPAGCVVQLLDLLLTGPLCSTATGWHKLLQVLRLPGAQQITADSVASLVTATLMHPERFTSVSSRLSKSDGDLALAKEAVLLVLLQLSGAKALTAETTALLAGGCLARGWQAAIECALKLPGAAALSLQQVKPWLMDAMLAKDKQLFDKVARLPAVVGAGAVDLDVQLWLAVMRDGCAVGRKKQYCTDV